VSGDGDTAIMPVAPGASDGYTGCGLAHPAPGGQTTLTSLAARHCHMTFFPDLVEQTQVSFQ